MESWAAELDSILDSGAPRGGGDSVPLVARALGGGAAPRPHDPPLKRTRDAQLEQL